VNLALHASVQVSAAPLIKFRTVFGLALCYGFFIFFFVYVCVCVCIPQLLFFIGCLKEEGNTLGNTFCQQPSKHLTFQSNATNVPSNQIAKRVFTHFKTNTYEYEYTHKKISFLNQNKNMHLKYLLFYIFFNYEYLAKKIINS